MSRRKHHEPGCLLRTQTFGPCTCDDLESGIITDFTRTPLKSAPLSDPNQPYQSLADLIRAARRAGHLRPVQQYGGGHAQPATP